MKRLIQNECIKLYRQNGFKVLIILVLVIATLLPVGAFALKQGVKLIDWLIEDNDTYEDSYEIAMEDAEDYQASGDTWSTIEAYRCYARADVYLFLAENDLEGTWKDSYFFSDLWSLSALVQTYEMLASGAVSAEDYYDEDGFYTVGTDLYEQLSPWQQAMYADVDEYIKMLKAVNFVGINWNAEHLRAVEAYEAKKTEVLEITPRQVIGRMVETQTEAVAEKEEILRVLQTEYQAALAAHRANPQDEDLLMAYEKALYARDEANADWMGEKDMLWAYELLYEKECDPDSWQYEAVEGQLRWAVQSYYTDCVIMPRSVYEEGNKDTYYDPVPYEEYVESVEKDPSLAVNQDRVAFLKCSLEKGVPIPSMLDDSPKTAYRTFFNMTLMAITVVMVVFAGTVVANEYTSGTVRLLLIRPKKRYKILSAKAIAVLLYSAGLTVVCATVTFVLCVILHGGLMGMFTPDIMCRNGVAMAMPSILYSFLDFSLRLLGSGLVVTMAFFFSVLFRRGILAVALPLVLYAGSFGVQMVTFLLTAVGLPLEYTILPYLNPSILLTQVYGTGLWSSMYSNILSLHPLLGVAYFLLPIGVFISLSYVLFVRQQIKN